MVDDKFRLKIVDFGMARKLPTNHEPSKPIGHPFYRAPEFLLAPIYDKKVDIWSIGCIFGELVTGRILFEGKNETDQMNKIIEIIGSPSNEYILTLHPTIQEYIRTFSVRNSLPWEQLFPDSEFPPSDKSFCSARNGRNLLARLLVFDPNERIAIEDALNYPYVAWRREPDEVDQVENQDDEAKPRGVYDEQIENTRQTIDEYKKDLFALLQAYSIKNLH